MDAPTAVTQPNPTPVPAVSPTGEAILPAKYVPLAMGLASLPAAIAGAFSAASMFPKGVTYLTISSGVLWAILGVISPGLRRAVQDGAGKALVAAVLGAWLLLGGRAMAQEAKFAEDSRLRYGPTASMLEFRPGLASPVALSPGVGFQVGYDFRVWSLEGAFFGNALQVIGAAAPGGELSAAIYGCWRAVGVCGGPLVVLAGPSGGLLNDFTWKRSVGAVLSLNGDLLSFLQSGILGPKAQAWAE